MTCLSLYSSSGQNRQINASVTYCTAKWTRQTETIDAGWRVIRIRSAQITRTLQHRCIEWCVHSPQSLHKICHSPAWDVWKSGLQLLSHAAKGHGKYCHSLPDSRTQPQQIFHLRSHKGLAALGAQTQEKNVEYNEANCELKGGERMATINMKLFFLEKVPFFQALKSPGNATRLHFEPKGQSQENKGQETRMLKKLNWTWRPELRGLR